jgi:hypothetical protein
MDIEVTIAGEAADVAPEIIHRRRRCRRELGWILDAFIVRPNDGDPSPDTPPAQPFCPPGSEVR